MALPLFIWSSLSTMNWQWVFPAMAGHIDNYIDRNRAVLKKPGPYKYIPDLHEIAAKACHVLRWSVKVLKSYDWRLRSAGEGSALYASLYTHWIVLYCIVLSCVVLYCIVLHCIVLDCIGLYCIVLCLLY